MIKAIIFDFDGLIIDTESVWFEVFHDIAKQDFHIELNIRDFALAVGTSTDPYYKLIEEQLGYSIDRLAFGQKAYTEFQNRVSSLHPRDGVKEYITYASNNGLKIGLATSSSYKWVLEYLEKFELFSYFDTIQTSDVVGTKKPDPKVYIEALKALELLPEEVIAFEDSLNGFTAAVRAGIKTVLVPNGLTKYIDFPSDSIKITSMADIELPLLLKQISQSKKKHN
ncbi:HAD-IA family hydrolase [[Brevibacterium] frigoritolerans]|nr:HAD-IA family hydrolase [Peribacillus frigoritolerans]